MGSHLVAFIHEVFHQRELLENAEERDDTARSMICGHYSERQPGRPKVWTRRDKRLVEVSDDGSMRHPRTECFLRRFLPERREGPHVPLLRAAIDEARREGTVTVLVPALEALADAHDLFLHYVQEIVQDVEPAEMQFPWHRVVGPYRDAGERILRFLPPECVRSQDCFWLGDYSPFESPVLSGDLPSAAAKGGGRPADPAIAGRNREIIKMFNAGSSVDEVCRRFPKVSAANARRIKSDAGLGPRKRRTKRQS